MGHSHYWEIKQDVTVKIWEKILTGAEVIFKHCKMNGIPLQFEADVSQPPQCDTDAIRFNGVDDNGYETFIVTPFQTDFSFCKTKQLPYDLAVIMVLLHLKQVLGKDIIINSDGKDDGSWTEAMTLYKKLFHKTPKMAFK
jgi:hypothetical protein